MNNLDVVEQKDFLYVSVADCILGHIRENKLNCGDRLPSERNLAELFKTSRTSVREAVRILENKGIIQIQIGKGMYLNSDLSDENYKIELWKIDYIELLDVKNVLEFHIIEELCKGMSETEVRSIEEPLRTLEKDYEIGAFSVLADNVFHNRIRRLSHNQTMIQMLDSLIMKLDTYGARIKGTEHAWLTTIPYHRDLFEAMKAHNVERAREAYKKIYEIDRNALEGILEMDQ